MGKQERKARERICSSSSYFLRCFGISRKIHSDKPNVDTCQEMKRKKETRSRSFSRPEKFGLKNGEIIPAPIYETEKQNSIVEDDKQTLFQVIRHVSDRKNIENETKEKDMNMNEHRDINPDPLSFLGCDTCHEQLTTIVHGGKLDPKKTIGSETKSKAVMEKSTRVRKGSRVGRFDPVIGISIIMLTLIIMLIWGRLCAILCSCTWFYFLPRLKEIATAAGKRKRKHKLIGDNKALSRLCSSNLDLNSDAYKKKVILEGFLVRQNRLSI